MDVIAMNRIAELERQLKEAEDRAEFAEDQYHVAIEDRDHAERQLAKADAALMDCIFIIELKYGNTDETANAVLKQARAAMIQDTMEEEEQ